MILTQIVALCKFALINYYIYSTQSQNTAEIVTGQWPYILSVCTRIYLYGNCVTVQKETLMEMTK